LAKARYGDKKPANLNRDLFSVETEKTPLKCPGDQAEGNELPFGTSLTHEIDAQWPLSEMLRTKSFSDFRYFQILKYLLIHDDLSWKWDLKSKLEIHLGFIYTLHT
jgi:hypothetical protein